MEPPASDERRPPWTTGRGRAGYDGRGCTAWWRRPPPASGTRWGLIHDGVTRLVYGGLRTGVAVGAEALQRVPFTVPDAEPPLGSAADMAIAALNGFAGDRLVQAGNPLATAMGVRQGGREVPAEPEALAAAFPDASPRLAVFVHGLACNEAAWRFYSERHYGDRETTYGSRLQAEHGHTPVYVRYNSGRHVSENGRDLARLLDAVVRSWPVEVEELVLVGHSMGGLVIRSGCHYAQEAAAAWTGRVRHVVYLGSPHAGAPLEKAVNAIAWLLGVDDVTRPFADVLNRRSAGIKDLRFGSLLETDWSGADLDELLFDRTGPVLPLPGARHYFVAATVTRDPRHPLGVAVGDLLVRGRSASGRRLRHVRFPLEHGRHFGAMNHLALLNHPDVYAELRRWLGTASPRVAGERSAD